MKKIITLPHKSLRQKSKRVVDFNDPEITKLIDEMKKATLAWEDSRKHEVGVALASVQINHLFRIIIIRHDFDDKHNRTFDVFINPEIVKYEGAVEEDYEGCLSIKDIYGKVPRYNKVRIKAYNENGVEIRLKTEGFLARVFQHEIDHTNGIMFVDHIKDNPEAFFMLDDTGKLQPVDYQEVKKEHHEVL